MSKPKNIERFSPVVEKSRTSIIAQPERFQGRENDFSGDTVRAIVAKGFYDNSASPIKVWWDALLDKYVVLAGHSRLTAWDELNKQGKASGRIPVIVFKGDQDDAMDYAIIESNRKSTEEGLISDLNAYRRAVKSGKSRKYLLSVFKPESKLGKLQKLMNLNPKGRFVEMLGGTSALSFPYLERNAQWIGDMRSQLPQLTNAHELELFKFIYDGGKGLKLNKDQLYKVVNDRVNRIDFNPDEALNLENRVSSSAYVDPINEEIAAVTKEIERSKKEIDQKRETIVRAKGEFGDVRKGEGAKITAPIFKRIEDLNRFILRKVEEREKLKQKAGRVERTVTADLFSEPAPSPVVSFLGNLNKAGKEKREATMQVQPSKPDYSFTYQMLSRLQSDCDYFLGAGNGHEPHLHQGSVSAQIAEMKRLWNTLPENAKPDWLSMKSILDYEDKMKKIVTKNNPSSKPSKRKYKIGDRVSKYGAANPKVGTIAEFDKEVDTLYWIQFDGDPKMRFLHEDRLEPAPSTKKEVKEVLTSTYKKPVAQSKTKSVSESAIDTFVEDLDVLDLWKYNEKDGRFYRKFEFTADENHRTITDLGIKEAVTERKNGVFDITISVRNESEAEKISDLYMSKFPNDAPANNDTPLLLGVTFDEYRVLAITYGIKAFARKDAFKRNGIGNYEEIRQQLIEKGYMAKNTALTPLGKKKERELLDALGNKFTSTDPWRFKAEEKFWKESVPTNLNKQVEKVFSQGKISPLLEYAAQLAVLDVQIIKSKGDKFAIKKANSIINKMEKSLPLDVDRWTKAAQNSINTTKTVIAANQPEGNLPAPWEYPDDLKDIPSGEWNKISELAEPGLRTMHSNIEALQQYVEKQWQADKVKWRTWFSTNTRVGYTFDAQLTFAAGNTLENPLVELKLSVPTEKSARFSNNQRVSGKPKFELAVYFHPEDENYSKNRNPQITEVSDKPFTFKEIVGAIDGYQTKLSYVQDFGESVSEPEKRWQDDPKNAGKLAVIDRQVKEVYAIGKEKHGLLQSDFDEKDIRETFDWSIQTPVEYVAQFVKENPKYKKPVAQSKTKSVSESADYRLPDDFDTRGYEFFLATDKNGVTGRGSNPIKGKPNKIFTLGYLREQVNKYPGGKVYIRPINYEDGEWKHWSEEPRIIGGLTWPEVQAKQQKVSVSRPILQGQRLPEDAVDVTNPPSTKKESRVDLWSDVELFRGGHELTEAKIKPEGISLTKNEEIGKYWASSKVDGKVFRYNLSKATKILTDIPKDILPRDTPPSHQDKERIVNHAKAKGYDGVDLSGIFSESEVRIFNLEAVEEIKTPPAKTIAPGLYIKLGAKKYEINSFEQISKVWHEYVMNQLDNNWENRDYIKREAVIYNSADEGVGRISQNGKIWLGAGFPIKNDAAGKPKYTPQPLVYDPYAEDKQLEETAPKSPDLELKRKRAKAFAFAQAQRIRIMNLK
jgi:hypothetical protein